MLLPIIRTRLFFSSNCCSICSRRFVRRGTQIIRHDRDGQRDNSAFLDPFGIKSVSKKTDIAGEYVMTEKEKTLADATWGELVTSRRKLANEQVSTEETFGRIRFDSQNVPKYHGQFGADNLKPAFDVDEHAKILETRSQELTEKEKNVDNCSSESVTKEQTNEDEENIELIDVNCIFPKRTSLEPRTHAMRAKFSFDFTQEWMETRGEEDEKIVSRAFQKHLKENEKDRNKDVPIFEGLQISKTSPLQSVEEMEDEFKELAEEEVKKKVKAQEAEEKRKIQEEEDRETGKIKEKPQTYEDLAGQELSAYKFVQKIKRGSIQVQDKRLEQEIKESDPTKLDNLGYNSYQGYTLDLTTLRRSELLWFLKKNVIFCDSGILAINKPHGLIVQGKLKKDKSPDPTLSEMLEEFSELLFKSKILLEKPDKLRIVHRLDKEATGVLVMATNAEKAAQLQKLFENREVIKTYHAITRGVPDHSEGIIDIPMEEGTVNGKERMVLRPEFREELRRIVSPSKMARRAVTNYKIVSSHRNAALLEVTPETGVKHQIRVHLGFGLRCPVLGDHKYSYLEKMCPQKLPSDMLVSLNVRQTKVRNIPLHLHALTVALPGAGMEGKTVILRANHPTFFRTTMKRLKLYT